jgi:glycosyltransferase involved in cell wall biosynthesis
MIKAVHHIPFFSVVICSLNRGYIIERALNSLISQTFSDWSAVIVDDGSDDNTFNIAKKYIDKYKNIKYLYISKRSLGLTRNCGIKASEGQFITFLDTDDEYKPNHLELRYNILNNSMNEFIASGLEIIGNPWVPDANNPKEFIHLSKCCVGGTFFLKRELFDTIGFFQDLTFADDFEFYNRAINSGIKIIKVDYPTYIYHRDSLDSICNNMEKQTD